MKEKPILSVWLLFVFLASLVLSACSGGASTPSGSFVGKVDGSDAFISVVVHANGEVTAYVCDGADISEWFKGTADGSSLDLTNANGASLTATLSANSASGTFTPAGDSALNFSAEIASEPAGLYRADLTYENTAYVGGWIVLPDGDQRGSIVGGGRTFSGSSLSTSTKTVTPGSDWIDPTPDPITVGWIDPDTDP